MKENSKPITKIQEQRWLSWMRFGKKLGCHQYKERSFFFHNRQFFVCARCTGILIGELIIGPILLIFGFNHPYLNFVFISILAIDGLLQFFHILPSTNTRRLITGVLGGVAMISLFVQLIDKIFIS